MNFFGQNKKLKLKLSYQQNIKKSTNKNNMRSTCDTIILIIHVCHTLPHLHWSTLMKNTIEKKIYLPYWMIIMMLKIKKITLITSPQFILTNKNMLTYLYFFKIHQFYLKKNSINVEFQFLPSLIQNSNSKQVMISLIEYSF